LSFRNKGQGWGWSSVAKSFLSVCKALASIEPQHWGVKKKKGKIKTFPDKNGRSSLHLDLPYEKC
jgi:hypothetical protein